MFQFVILLLFAYNGLFALIVILVTGQELAYLRQFWEMFSTVMAFFLPAEIGVMIKRARTQPSDNGGIIQ